MWSFRSNAEPRRWWWKGGKLPPKWDRSQPASWKWRRWRRHWSDCLTLQRGLICVSAVVLFPYFVAILATGHWTLMQFGCLVRCCAAALTVLTVGCTKYCSSVSHLAQMESAVWTLMTGSILKEVCPPSLQIYILQNHLLSQFGPFGGQVHVWHLQSNSSQCLNHSSY